MAAWAVIADLETHLGVEADVDGVMQNALDVSLDWCHRQRPDLDPAVDPGAAVSHAVVLYAGLLWREKASPQGFATYSEVTGGSMEAADAWYNIRRLLGVGRPVAR